MLIRFDTTSVRLPSAQLFQGLCDFVKGSLVAYLGTSDYDDIKPYNSANFNTVGGSAGAAVAHRTDRTGVLRFTATAGANANVEYTRPSYWNPSATPNLAREVGMTMTAQANTPKLFVGYSDVAAGSILAAAVLANGAAQNSIGLLWNGATSKIDIVSVVAGVAKTIKTDIGATVNPVTIGALKLGVRIEKVNATTYRVSPCVNGEIIRAGVTNTLNTNIPEVLMRSCVAHTVAATTAPSFDVDWDCTIDK